MPSHLCFLVVCTIEARGCVFPQVDLRDVYEFPVDFFEDLFTFVCLLFLRFRRIYQSTSRFVCIFFSA